MNKINLIALKTLLFKEVYRFMRIWPQTILPSAITTSLYFLIFGQLIGTRIGPIEGIPYIAYIVPGIVLMSVITNAYNNVVFSFYSAKFQRNIEELLVSPVSNGIVLAGYIGGGIVRGLAVGGVVAGVGAFFTPFHVIHPWVIVGIILLTALLFSLGGFINAVYAKSFDDVSIVPNFVLTPLVYLGGVFYSTNLLPPFWQHISHANPILYMVNAFRYGVLGVSDVEINLAFWIVGATILVLWSWALLLLHWGTGLKS